MNKFTIMNSSTLFQFVSHLKSETLFLNDPISCPIEYFKFLNDHLTWKEIESRIFKKKIYPLGFLCSRLEKTPGPVFSLELFNPCKQQSTKNLSTFGRYLPPVARKITHCHDDPMPSFFRIPPSRFLLYRFWNGFRLSMLFPLL